MCLSGCGRESGCLKRVRKDARQATIIAAEQSVSWIPLALFCLLLKQEGGILTNDLLNATPHIGPGRVRLT